MKPEHPTKVEKELPKDEVIKESVRESEKGWVEQKLIPDPMAQQQATVEKLLEEGKGNRIFIIRTASLQYSVIPEDNIMIEAVPDILRSCADDVKVNIDKLRKK